MTINTEYTGANYPIVAEAEENLKMLFGTFKGSIALDRDYGIDISVLELPMIAAEARLTAEIITAAAKYENRANISDIVFNFDTCGNVKVKVVWQLVDD